MDLLRDSMVYYDIVDVTPLPRDISSHMAGGRGGRTTGLLTATGQGNSAESLQKYPTTGNYPPLNIRIFSFLIFFYFIDFWFGFVNISIKKKEKKILYIKQVFKYCKALLWLRGECDFKMYFFVCLMRVIVPCTYLLLTTLLSVKHCTSRENYRHKEMSYSRCLTEHIAKIYFMRKTTDTFLHHGKQRGFKDISCTRRYENQNFW